MIKRSINVTEMKRNTLSTYRTTKYLNIQIINEQKHSVPKLKEVKRKMFLHFV